MPTTAQLEEQSARLAEASELASSANDNYAAKDYTAAIRGYHKCLLKARAVSLTVVPPLAALVDAPADNDDGGSATAPAADAHAVEAVRSAAEQLVLRCYNNLAACILNGDSKRTADDFARAAAYCDNVLKVDANNEKAKFRKGACLRKAGRFEDAIDLFETMPDSVEAQRCLKETQAELAAERKRTNEIIQQRLQRGFAKATAPPAAAVEPAANGGAHVANGDVQQAEHAV